MGTRVSIAGRQIGDGCPVYIIAELSANHNQDYQRAVDMVHAAAAAGADAVKIQTYTPDTITLDCDRPCFRIGGGTLWDGNTLYRLYQEAYTPWEWQPDLKQVADNLGIALFSTPFDFSAVDFLEKMAVPAYKIASFELVDIPLIRQVAATGKPLIISTGMADLTEIDEAVETVRETGNEQLILLKCTSSYPASPEDMNLMTIPDMAERFEVIAGLSDHSTGAEVAVAAVALGARVIEKHFTLDKKEPGPDSAFSMEPDEFGEFVASVRLAEKSLGTVSYAPTEKEAACRHLRRSLFAVSDIREGGVLCPDNIRSIRPGDGLHTRHYESLLYQYRAVCDIAKGTPLNWDLIKKI